MTTIEELESRVTELERREKERRDCPCVLERRDAMVASVRDRGLMMLDRCVERLAARCICCGRPFLGTAQDGPFCGCDR